MDPNLILFIVLAIFILGGFFGLIIFLGKCSEKQEVDLFKTLSKKLGFAYCESDTIGLEGKITSLESDFAKSPINPLKQIVYGIESGSSVYLFDRDAPLVGSARNNIIPSWSVCLIEAGKSFGFEAVIFHRDFGAGFSKLKEYKTALEKLSEVNVDKPEFVKPQPNRLGITVIRDRYILKTSDLTKCRKAVEKGVVDVFLKHRVNFKVMRMNMMMAIHVKNNLLAIYTDHPGVNLGKVEQFEQLYQFAREIKETLT